jgi:capsular exopolysaccharide synthesis family protein
MGFLRMEATPRVDLLGAIRRQWRVVLLLTAVVTAAALAVSLSSTKQYEATAELLLRGQEPVDELLNPGGGGGSRDPERDLNTEVELIKVGPPATAAARELRLGRSVDALLEDIEVEASTSTNLVSVTARDEDPVLAARIANTLARSYIDYRLQSARRRYSEAADLARRQLASLTPGERATEQARLLEARQRELELAAALQTGGAELIRSASAPQSPVRPRPILSAGLGLFLGALLGLGAALVRELFDRGLKSEDDAARLFAAPILAAIPRRRRGAGADASQREQFGLLAANLGLAGTPGAGSRVLMISSSVPAEGKTTVTLGLAHACSRLGLRVVAIEADLRQPTFLKHVEAGSVGGLASVIDGSTTLFEELVRVEGQTPRRSSSALSREGSLAVVPAGRPPANPQLALSRATMRRAVEDARSIADVVLIDTAPMGTVNDAVVLTELVDGVVFVVRLKHTTAAAAHRARRLLTNLGCPLSGLVVTDAEGTEGAGYYDAVPARIPADQRA